MGNGQSTQAGKQEVGDEAESNGTPRGMLDQIKNLEGGQFSGPQNVIAKLQGVG